MHIGIDDTDSTIRGCTTYVAALIIDELRKNGVKFVDYPNLIRLNPNVPWKTRGNGALCLRIEYEENQAPEIMEKTIELVEEQSDLSFKGTDPGIVFLTTHHIPSEITDFAKKTETRIVTLRRAVQLIQEYHAEAVGYNTQRGLIGALAAIGETLSGDYTYELIAYRKPENFGTRRRIDEASILEMDQKLQPFTFNNIDTEKR